LRANPLAFVGEIGIDKVSKTIYGVNEFELQVNNLLKRSWRGMNYNGLLQIQVFERQMEIASKLQRPVTVHCVRAQGYLFDYFRNTYTTHKKNNGNEIKIMPPAVMLHSFGKGPLRSASLKGIRIFWDQIHLLNFFFLRWQARYDKVPFGTKIHKLQVLFLVLNCYKWQ